MKQLKVDVVIIGGGLAGLTLAQQLRDTNPSLTIAVVERNCYPVPTATAKIGESTVEIGAHYLTKTLGLQSHFEQHHLVKHGLRCFFGQSSADFSQQDELGVSELFGVPAYQLERGVLENYLSDHLKHQGVIFIEGADISPPELTKRKQQSNSLNKRHSLTVRQSARGPLTLQSCWMIDAAGRQAILKKTLGLNKPTAHKGNALWFRVDIAIVIDDWTQNVEWRDRLVEPETRWLSTNHLMGAGYWIWIIPLGSGVTSIGIVMDDPAWKQSQLQTYEQTLVWLRHEQPFLYQALVGSETQKATALDFVRIEDYAFDCQKMFSDDKWGLTGEAGVFADPFYSPGSDFIAMNNTFITDLINKESSGHNIAIDSLVFHKINQSFFANTVSLYTGQYGGFGDRKMMAVKLVWDYAYYWGVLSVLFFNNAITDIELMRKLNPVLIIAQALNQTVQQHLKQRAAQRLVLAPEGIFFNQFNIPCLRHFNAVLKASPLECIETALTENVELLQGLASLLPDMLNESASRHISTHERTLLGGYRHCVLA